MKTKTIYHRMKGLNTRMMANYNRADLESFCKEKALVILRPTQALPR